MKFYLARHAFAESGDPMDVTRQLTSEGKKQIPLMIDFLKSQTKKITAVMYSDMLRGIDTAIPIAEALDAEEIQTPIVGPDGDIEDAWKLITKWGKANEGELLIISHGKFINRFAAWLLESGEGDKFHFSHGSVAHFDTERPDGYGPYNGGDKGQPAVFHWMVTAKVMLRFQEDDPKAILESANRVVRAYEEMLSDTSREESEVIEAARELISVL
jgi:phosphohistidine phosphatase SixA